MKFKEALKRLHYTISNKNKPNQTDADAFNSLTEFLKLSDEKTLQENLLFAKLYAYLLTEFLNKYTEIDFANKEINRILSESMELRSYYLELSLKRMELQNYFKQKKVLDPFLKQKTADELEQVHERYLNKLPELNAFDFAKCGTNWNTEIIKYNLETSINLSIQNFKNNV